MVKKLFIPGPTDVSKGAFEAMSTPMIGHRGPEFSTLFADCIEGLKKLMYTGNRIMIFPASSTGLMEAAVRNCVKKKCLNVCNGAFSERWYDITVSNGKEADKLSFEWGSAPEAARIDEMLATGEYDALTLVHNETSTGVMAPIDEISQVIKKYDVSFLVDTVSSMGGTKIEVDRLGIDVCLFGSQKAMALPAGLAACSISQKAMDKATGITNRGYYFDFITYDKYLQKEQTPTTAPISLMQGLRYQLRNILEIEGLENRFARHEAMARYARDWAKKNFELYCDEKYSSKTLTCVKNTRGVDLKDLKGRLSEKGYVFAPGYGKIKDSTFRIAHMGERTMDELREYLESIDGILGL